MNDDILIKIMTGEIDVPELNTTPHIWAFKEGISDGPFLVESIVLYYLYCRWCEKTQHDQVTYNTFSKCFKFKKKATPKIKWYISKDIKFSDKERNELIKWQANKERKERAQKKRTASLKPYLKKQKQKRQLEERKEKRKQYQKKYRAREVQKRKEELPDENLIAILDLKNSTSQE